MSLPSKLPSMVGILSILQSRSSIITRVLADADMWKPVGDTKDHLPFCWIPIDFKFSKAVYRTHWDAPNTQQGGDGSPVFILGYFADVTRKEMNSEKGKSQPSPRPSGVMGHRCQEGDLQRAIEEPSKSDEYSHSSKH